MSAQDQEKGARLENSSCDAWGQRQSCEAVRSAGTEDRAGKGKGAQSTEESRHSGTSLYETTVVDTCHDTFVQTRRTHSSGRGPGRAARVLGDDGVSVRAHP